MKRVLIVASVISFIEWFNKENVSFLHDEMGCEVHIACNFEYMEDTDEARTVAYIESLKASGVILHQVPFDRSPLGRQNLAAYKQLKSIIDSVHFDLIHCHTPAASVYTRLAARRARKSGAVVMYTCHGFHFHASSPKKNWLIYYPIEKALSRCCDYLVTINHEDYRMARTFHAKHVRYIPGVGVDLKRIQNAAIDRAEYRSSIGIPEGAVMLLSLGELIERKNHEVIIRALALLNRDDVYYVICGKGPLHDHLISLAKDLNVAERVILLGFRTDVPELCNAADIGAFPSKIEGLGLAGIEIMAAEVPLVASNVHGILDYVRDGETGYICPPQDEKAFTAAIGRLLEDPALTEKMRGNCIEAVKPFDIDNALGVMRGIYKEILKA